MGSFRGVEGVELGFWGLKEIFGRFKGLKIGALGGLKSILGYFGGFKGLKWDFWGDLGVLGELKGLNWDFGVSREDFGEV